MRKLLILILIVSSFAASAQLPSKNPSFTVTQQVGLATAEFTFRPISLENPLETYLLKESTYYPGGRSFFIVRISEDMTFQDIKIEKGSYVGGFKGEMSDLKLTLEPEEVEGINLDELKIKIPEIPLEPIGEFNCQIEGQSFMVMPFQGTIRSSAIIFTLTDQSFLLTMDFDDKELFEKITNELNSGKSKSTEKYLMAAEYAIESDNINEDVLTWLDKAQSDKKYWKTYWLTAKALAGQKNIEEAINYGNQASRIIIKDTQLNKIQISEIQSEIIDQVKLWEQQL